MMTRDIRINVPAGVPALPSEHLQELPVRAAKSIASPCISSTAEVRNLMELRVPGALRRFFPLLCRQSFLLPPVHFPLQVPGTLAAGAERPPATMRVTRDLSNLIRPPSGAGGAPLRASEGTAAREAWRSMSDRNRHSKQQQTSTQDTGLRPQ